MEKDLQKVLDEIENYRAKGIDYTLSKTSDTVAKIINIADSADPVLRQQAEAFRERMFYVIVHALNQAVKSDRTTLYNEFKKQGHADVAETLRKL